MLAALYDNLADQRLRCRLCAHGCVLALGHRGLCGVRKNEDGVLHTLVGNNVAALQVDPVEKKPLYHYRPGSATFSLGTMGCNFACKFCQNANISRHPALTGQVQGRTSTPQDLVRAARESGCRSLAFTYNEPTVFFEQMLATARLAATEGLDCVMVSNGYQSEECLNALGPHIRAANIDLKSFRDDFYQKLCKARLLPVLENLRRMVQMDWWLEVTTLVIPGYNDSPEELNDIAGFIADELGKGVPWHVSAFRPCFEMQNTPPTPPSTLELAREIGLARGLSFVYAGNTSLSFNTQCPECGADFITRSGWAIQKHALAECCAVCAAPVPGIWD